MCYLENCPNPERYLNIYGLAKNDLPLFDNLGKFFPFGEFYVRGLNGYTSRAICDLNLSEKPFILPWMYWPVGINDTLHGKQIICPSSEMFNILDNKVETKKIFEKLNIPTPKWSFVNNCKKMLEKPIRDSAGGLGIRLTNSNPQDGCFLEEYLIAHCSIGLQFFVYDEVEFICADEMLFYSDGNPKFTFHAQKNVQQNELSKELMKDCFNLGKYLLIEGYKGFLGIDVLVGDNGHFFLEVNPRGIAFLPAFFAASSLGWQNFMTYMNYREVEEQELVLLDFGKSKKVVRKN